MIEISENKADELKEYAYKSMKHLGKLYECIEELCDESRLGERRGDIRYDDRGERMGYRELWDEDPYMGERRGRSMATGRYMRR